MSRRWPATKREFMTPAKTTPGWRRLEKYAVRCGGGWNHRSGLFDAVLIKDNHIALWTAMGGAGHTPAPIAEAVRASPTVLGSPAPDPPIGRRSSEVEVDSLRQLDRCCRPGPTSSSWTTWTRQTPSGRRPAGPRQRGRRIGGVRRHRPQHRPPCGRDRGDRISVGALNPFGGRLGCRARLVGGNP